MTGSATAPPSEKAAPSWRSGGRGGRAGNGFFVLLIRSGLMWTAPFFLSWVALYFLVAAPSARRASFDLARRVGRGSHLPARCWFAFRHFYTFGMLLLDRVAILGAGQIDKYQTSYHGDEVIFSALRAGQGILLQSAHLGNWEVMGHLIPRFEAPFCMVMLETIDARMRATMEDMARDRSFRILYSDGSPASAAAILAALRRGEMVGMMGDRVVAGQSVAVDILGGKVALPSGAYVVCAAGRAPLVHAFAVRTGWRRYEFHAFPAGELVYRDRRRKFDDIQKWASDYGAELERFLTLYPWQWGNFFPFWETRP